MNGKSATWEEAVAWLKTQPDQIDLVYACFYDDPLLASARRYHDGSEWQAVRKYLPTTLGRALDLGAGRGIASYALARDGWNVTALEPDPSALVGANAIRLLAKESGLRIQVEEKWGERLPFPDESFDLVHARQVLHHARDLQQLCLEAARVLKTDGVFIATREHVISRHDDLPEFLAAHPLHKLYGGENAYLLAEYVAAISGAGVKLKTVLNPFQSDINLYPDTRASKIRRIAIKLGLPRVYFPESMLGYLGRFNNTPGRLYSFIGRKR